MEIINTAYTPLAGVTFKDAQYEYRIYVKSGSLGDGEITSISIFIENTPDKVGMDLALYALEHVAKVAGEDLQTSEFMINKILIEDYPAIGEMLTLLSDGNKTLYGLQPFKSLLEKVKINLSKNVDFEEINNIINIRKKKFGKVLNYMANNLKEIDGININEIKYGISGQPHRVKDTLLAPTVTITINVKLDIDPYEDLSVKREKAGLVKTMVRTTFDELSPLDIFSYDTFTINIV